MFDHVTIRVDDDAASGRFHEAATSAGYVLDPDGNNVAVVNHHRDG